MLLRRFAKHLKTQDWTAITIEFGIVVLGVFVGLEVQNWNQSRIEREAAVTYHGRILEEIRRNEHNLMARRDYYEQIRSHAQAARTSLRADASKLDGQFLVDAYMATQRWLLEIDRGVYDEILSAGVVDTVLDPDSRMRLSNYYVVFESVLTTITDDTKYRNLVRMHLPVELQRDIESHCGDEVKTDARGAVSISLSSKVPEWEAETVNWGVTALLDQPELRASLNFRISDVDTKITVLERNIQRTRALAYHFEDRRPTVAAR